MKKIVVFSGAGMSAESGIQTFRGNDGLWENYKIEDVATPSAWNKDPDLVTTFYNQRRKSVLNASPNKAHYAIANLESIAEVTVITQNIDDLHERSGSKNVLHLHGNIRYSKSSGPNQEREYYPVDGWELTPEDVCPEGYRLRPHVVWFGEDVPAYPDAIEILRSADILIVIGTSLQVYPAAGLIHYAENAVNKYIIDPNAEELIVPSDFTKINAGASDGIHQLREKLLEILR
ncbi:MAG: NAD-dependent deacylase [Crocinitomicaceae bacterium]|nr:NAD-dependent deacylase [Crocinitomicaceae bacterium]